MRSSNKGLGPKLLRALPVTASLIPLATAGGAALAESGAGDVAEAIRRGRDALVLVLERQLSNRPEDYPMGRIALSAAAVLEAGIPPAHPAVRRAFQVLERMPLHETYSVACYLLALDASWQASLLEEMKLIAGTKDAARRAGKQATAVEPSGSARAKMAELVAFLMNGSGGIWTYTTRFQGDLSNTQFAMLGLEVALENDIPVPVEVFSEVAAAILEKRWTSPNRTAFTLGYRSPAWPGVIPGTTRTVDRSARPGGWNYELNRRLQPQAAMTAAGLSSLLVARKGLRRGGALTPELEASIDGGILEALAWISKNLPEFSNPYALYSLEKVCDLAGIDAIAGRDWYAAGSRHLISRQEVNGSFGDDADSGLALLFLSRATRSRLHTHGPPVFVTPRGGEAVPETRTDLVHITAAGGFIPAGVLFEFADLCRHSKLGPILDEALNAMPPERTHEALARVLWLWSEDDDAMTRWARRAATRLTGIELESRRAYQEIAGKLEDLRAMELDEAPDAGRIGSLLAGAGSPVLKRRTLDLVERSGAADAFGAVADLVEDRDPLVRRRAHDVLSRWTGLVHAIPPPELEASVKALAEAARPWKEWWKEEGDAFCARRRVSRLIEGMERARDAERREAALEAIVSEGPLAVPPIIEAMDRGEFSIHLVRALARITGESRGIRAGDWKR